MSLIEQETFIKSIHPFDLLNSYELETISKYLDIVYFKESDIIIDKDEKPQFLYFIIKGVVQEIYQDEVIGVFSSNEFFDPISIIENKIKHKFLAIEEAICYTLPKEIFLKNIYSNETIERFFFSTISQKLNQNITKEKNNHLVDLMISKVSDIYTKKIDILDDISIYDTVLYMKNKNLSSVLIKHDGNIGIVTDTDFREKVILDKLSFDENVSKIASYDLLYVYEDDFLFNAQLLMNKHNIKRVVVKNRDEQIVSILELLSLTSFFASHTYAVTNELENATSLSELKSASKNFIRVIRTLYIKGVKVRYISKLISQLNEKLFDKLFLLLASNNIKENSSLIIMGSEGRGEQILRTDQDNALILKDNHNIDQNELIEFTEQFTKYLIEFGYPKCDGNIMVSNENWRFTQTQLKSTLHDWINSGKYDEMMNLAIFFDAKSVAGDESLLKNVKVYLMEISDFSPSFYSHFVKPIESFETPLNIFVRFILDKDKHKNELDIKKGGIFAIVHGIRALSLENSIIETNTIERIKELNNKEILNREMASELIEAFNFLLTIRLKSRLAKIDSQKQLDNYINPDRLSTLEKDLLRDSFKIVNRFKKFLSFHYKLHLVG